jgi:hypothetical protein
MKLTNVLLVGGAIYIGYWLLKKKPTIIDVKPDILPKKEEAKTIILNLNTNETPKKVNTFYEDAFVRDYNSSQMATVSPPLVTIKNPF